MIVAVFQRLIFCPLPLASFVFPRPGAAEEFRPLVEAAA